MKRLNLADYPQKQLEDFSKYVFGTSYQTLSTVMEQQKGREEQCRKNRFWWKRPIIEKVLPYADDVHEHTSIYQLNEFNLMYQRLPDYIKAEYKQLLTYYENLEELYNYRYVVICYPDCKSMIDVARFKLATSPAFQNLSEDCQTYYFDYEAYANHLQENGRFLETEHGIYEIPL